MAKIPLTYNFNAIHNMSQEELLRQLERMYTQLALAINQKPDIIERASDGSTADVFLSNGDININTSTRKVEMLTEHTSTTAVIWSQLS